MKKALLVVMALLMIGSLTFSQNAPVPESKKFHGLIMVNGDNTGNANKSASGWFGMDAIQPISIALTNLTGGYLGAFVVSTTPYTSNIDNKVIEWEVTLDPLALPYIHIYQTLTSGEGGNEIALTWWFKDLGAPAGQPPPYPGTVNYTLWAPGTSYPFPQAAYDAHNGKIWIKCQVENVTAKLAGHSEFEQKVQVAYSSI